MTAVPRVEAADVEQTITADVHKRCPFTEEYDDGIAVLTYRTAGHALELHALAAYLATFEDAPLSHEDFTAQLARDLNVEVTTCWTTAGLRVVCRAVP